MNGVIRWRGQETSKIRVQGLVVMNNVHPTIGSLSVRVLLILEWFREWGRSPEDLAICRSRHRNFLMNLSIIGSLHLIALRSIDTILKLHCDLGW